MRRGEGVPDLEEFLLRFSGMSLRPDGSNDTVITGDFELDAETNSRPRVRDCFQLQIRIPRAYPFELPFVSETGGRIARIPENHVNTDGTLCLGSPLRLMLLLGETPALVSFTHKAIVPFLYAFALREREGGGLVFGELDHAGRGLLHDYGALLRLSKTDQIIAALKCATLKKRLANKQACPCGCGKRLGRCPLHHRINRLRKLIPRKWLRAQLP